MGLCGLQSRGWFAGPSQGSREDGAQLWRPLGGPSPSAEHVPISLTLCWDRRCLPPSPHLNHINEVIAKRAGTWQVLGTGMQASWEPDSASPRGPWHADGPAGGTACPHLTEALQATTTVSKPRGACAAAPGTSAAAVSLCRSLIRSVACTEVPLGWSGTCRNCGTRARQVCGKRARHMGTDPHKGSAVGVEAEMGSVCSQEPERRLQQKLMEAWSTPL